MNSVEKIITEYQQKNWLNAQIIIAKNEQVIYQKNIGFADRELKMPFSEDALFPIASISKQFMAVGILLLIEEGEIFLHQFLSDIINANHPIWQGDMPTWADQVTVHHMLAHTSGLKDYTEEILADIENIADADMLHCIISQIKQYPLLSPPGESWHYSNTGYLFLYLIIEKFSHEHNVNQFFNDRIFKPLKMINTFIPSVQQERVYLRQVNQKNNFPIRYVADLHNLDAPPKKLQRLRFQVPVIGGANMISTARDLLKWNTAFYHGKVLSKKSFDLFSFPHYSGAVTGDTSGEKIQHGYGIFIINEKPENAIYEHGGWIEGIRNHLSFCTKSKITVLLLSNLSPDELQDKEKQYKQFYQFADLAQSIMKIMSSEEKNGGLI